MEAKDCKVGMKVRFIDEEHHREHPKWYPAVGTIGTISRITSASIYVQWPKGSTSDIDQWYCNANWVEKVKENLTDHEIWDMLRAKMEKNGVKVDCFKIVSNVDFPNLRAFNYPLYSKEALIKAVALAYRVGYKRAEKGRPFKYGDKVEKPKKVEETKKNGHWEPVDPDNLPPVGTKLRLAKKVGQFDGFNGFSIGDIFYRTTKNVTLFDAYKELWVSRDEEGTCPFCSSAHPERFEYWAED